MREHSERIFDESEMQEAHRIGYLQCKQEYSNHIELAELVTNEDICSDVELKSLKDYEKFAELKQQIRSKQ